MGDHMLIIEDLRARAHNARESASKRGRTTGLEAFAIRSSDIVCCKKSIRSKWAIVLWDWDEDNNRVCAKCGESLEGRFK